MYDSLEMAVKTVLSLPDFRVAPQRAALLTFLWNHRDEAMTAEDIWDDALHALKKGDEKDDPEYDYKEAVRQSCCDLRDQLRKHFAQAKYGWCIALPDAVRHKGYQLRCITLGDPKTTTREFWDAHLSTSHEISLVYPQELFYQDWPRRFTFRYAYLNTTHDKTALDQLKVTHSDLHNEHVNAVHPFVAAGHIGARDLVAQWFSENALAKVRSAVAGRMDDKSLTESSLILFGSAATNEVIADVLGDRTARHLIFSLQSDGMNADGTPFSRIRIKGDLDPEELERIEPFHPVREGSGYYIDNAPEEGTELAILTRLRSPFSETAITIFNCMTGSGVEQIARLFTDEERMQRGVKAYDWPLPMPQSFEILYAIPIGSITREHRRPRVLDPLLWRLYPSTGPSPVMQQKR